MILEASYWRKWRKRVSVDHHTTTGKVKEKYVNGAKSIIPSDLGRVLTSYLKKVFEDFFIETRFTARMEARPR